jgi:murein L,D-transpeptidase YcbB/YkuD
MWPGRPSTRPLAGATFALCALLALGAHAQERAPTGSLAQRLAALRAGEAPSVRGESLLTRDTLPQVYAATGNDLLWRQAAQRAALLGAIRAAADDGLTPADYHLAALEQLPADAAIGADDDLLASDAYCLLLQHLALGKVDPLRLEPSWQLPLARSRRQAAIAAVIAALQDGSIAEAANRVRPQHYFYERGRAALAQYRRIAAAGGWPALPAGPRLDPGAVDERVPILRRRLAASGDLAHGEDPSNRYDAVLAAGVRAFQARHLLPADGVVGEATRRALNVPVQARIDALRLNLERGRWVLNDIGDGDLVVVDIAGFGVRYLRDRRVIWRSRAIVGRTARQTPVFRARIDHVILNPTWTVPPTILAKDVLPAMQRGEDALGHKHLQVYDRSGQPVDPATIDWKEQSAATFPYVLRQDSGEANALGRIKINFDNSYSIYLHDTPSQELFARSERSFSSGCIRIDRPLELAELVLGDPVRWSAAALSAAIDTGTTRSIAVTRAVPVLIMYWTAEVDADGHVVFKRDIYSRDTRLLYQLDRRPGRPAQPRGRRPPPA